MKNEITKIGIHVRRKKKLPTPPEWTYFAKSMANMSQALALICAAMYSGLKLIA